VSHRASVRSVRIATAACAVLALSVAASSLRADVIYSNLGPGDTWNAGGSTLIGSLPSSTTTLTVAAAFTPTLSYSVDQVEAVLSSFESPGNNLRFIIHANNSGKPGAELGHVDQLVTAPSPTLVSVGFSGANVTLAAGQTYWLSILNLDATTTNGESGSWVYSDQTGYAYFYSHQGQWFNSSGNTGAYRISGTPAVPEPASLALLGLGGLAGLRRRSMRT